MLMDDIRSGPFESGTNVTIGGRYLNSKLAKRSSDAASKFLPSFLPENALINRR